MSDTPRRPLVPLSFAERARRLADMPVPQAIDRNGSPSPIALTPAERLAAEAPGLPAIPQEKPVPFIPPQLAAVAGVLATALAAAAGFAPQLSFLPPWAPFALWALAAVAALLAGVAIPPFKGGPLASAVATPIILAVSMALKTFATQLTPGAAQNIVLLLSLLADALAGKAIPAPVTADAKSAALKSANGG